MTQPHDEHPAEAHESPVADALRRLDTLGERPVEEHVEVYEQVHGVLRRSLESGSAGSSS